jgi:hypothetical protein
MIDKKFMARVAHEINKQICILNGEQALNYEDMPAYIIENMEESILNLDEGRTLGSSHSEWLKERIAQGWVYGPVKDTENKISPLICPFEDLTYSQKVKNCIFVGIKNAVHDADVQAKIKYMQWFDTK